jgi:hypothetical protein
MQSVNWRGSIADMLWWEFSESIKVFRETIISPATATLAELESANEPPSDGKAAMANYRGQVSARSARNTLALGLAGLWESQFREHLGKSANIIKAGGINSKKVEAAGSLARLEEYFQTVRGFPLSSFPQYTTIKALIAVGNAARHGNGYSSGTVHRTYPQYFSSDRPHAGWYSYYLHGATQPEDVRYLAITADHLNEFADAITSFWEEISRLSKSAKKGAG